MTKIHTIGDFLNQHDDIETDLVTLSDAIWIAPDLQLLQQQTSHEAFLIFIAIQTVGCSLSDGWGVGVFGNMPEIVPHLVEACDAMQWQALTPFIKDVIACFPAHTDFTQNNQGYCDVINLLEKHERYVEDKTYLNSLSPEARQQLQQRYAQALMALEEQCLNMWGEEPWQAVFDYASKHQHLPLFKQ